jgi:hypothetical protein
MRRETRKGEVQKKGEVFSLRDVRGKWENGLLKGRWPKRVNTEVEPLCYRSRFQKREEKKRLSRQMCNKNVRAQRTAALFTFHY